LLSSLVLLLCSCLVRPPPSSTLCPYTTLFRSRPPSLKHKRRKPFKVSVPNPSLHFYSTDPSMSPSSPSVPDPSMLSGFGTEGDEDRKSTRLNSSHVSISYAVFCLKKKNKIHKT